MDPKELGLFREAYASIYEKKEKSEMEDKSECEDEEYGKKSKHSKKEKEESESVEEGFGEKAAELLDKGTKKIQGGLEKMGVPINRTKRGTVTKADQEKRIQQNNSADLFDIVKGHLVSEGLTEEEAIQKMVTMTEEERNAIVEAPGEWFGGLRDRARASRAAQMQSSQPTPKPLPSSSSPFAKPASRDDSGKLTTYGAGGGAAAERAGQTRAQVMQQGAKNLENKKSKPVNQGPDFGR